MFENKILIENKSTIKKFSQYKIDPLESGDFRIGLGEDLTIEDVQIETTDIAYEFARIRTHEEIIDFSQTYGLLGLHPANQFIKGDHYTYLKNYALLRSPVGPESVLEWKLHADHVRKLLRLYRDMTNGFPIEDDTLRIEELQIRDSTFVQAFYAALQSSWDQEHYRWGNRDILQVENLRKANTSKANIIKPPDHGLKKSFDNANLHYFWADNLPTLLPYREQIPASDEGYHVIAKMILMYHLEEMLTYSIYIDFRQVSNILPLQKASDLRFIDRKATPYLLTAIYYDVWRIVNNRERVEECKSCGLPFRIQRTGALYCRKACKQHEWRKSKSTSKG